MMIVQHPYGGVFIFSPQRTQKQILDNPYLPNPYLPNPLSPLRRARGSCVGGEINYMTFADPLRKAE
jgi:hypothetical protein